MGQQPYSGRSRFTVEVSTAHNEAADSVRLLWTNDQSVAETST
jgi:hypothetical protein